MSLAKLVAWYGEDINISLRAEELARKALANGAFFEAELALGFSLDAQGRVEPAREAYERAIALDPSNYGARASLAYLLQVKGRLVEALSHNMIAFEHAPPGVLDTQIASCLRLLGFYVVASEWLDRTDRLDPDSVHAAPTRALDLITRGELQQGRAVIDSALERGVIQVELYEFLLVLALIDDDIQSALAIIDSVPESINHRGPIIAWRSIVNALGDQAGGEAIELSRRLQQDIDGGETWPETYLYIAMLNAAAGKFDDAITALQKLDAAGYRDFLWLEVSPIFRPLRSDPRFQAIISNIRNDVERQRAQVLTAEWLPPELQASEAELITP
jgi:tetratricopeptide (TPR) repeat protein